MIYATGFNLDALLASAVPVLQPASKDAAAIRSLFGAVFVICVVIFVVVVGLIVTALIRFRPAGGDRGELPRQNFGNHRLEIAWAIPPVLIVLALSVMSGKFIVSNDPAASDADLVVVGHQWWWEARYPKSGGAGAGVVLTANEIHIPVGRRLLVRVESVDVIHSFWVPQLAPKMDMVPGQPNYVWLSADHSGTYEGACAEFCGDQHAWMRFTVVAEPEAQFERWLEHQAKPAESPATGTAQVGKIFFFTQTCANCHAIGGTSAVATAAPDLTHFASRKQFAAGLLDNTPENLTRFLKNPQNDKPGCQMPNFSLTDDQATQLVAYVEGLR